MKASFVILCFLLASSFFIPTSIMARQLLQPGHVSVPITSCGRGQPYGNCIPNRPPPKMNCDPYRRGRGCHGYPPKP
ncbi:hypothetical protein V6N13_049722 [Hibiscus sabdariffa]